MKVPDYLSILGLVILGVCGICASGSMGNRKDFPEVTIAQGTLRGAYKTSRSGKTFASFTKIPFAKPPIGELRFKAPEPADSWTGIYDATQTVPKCLQKDYVSYRQPPIEGTEDCLYINVFTPKTALNARPSKFLPVMVYIHYGGNFAGTSQVGVAGPEYLMDKPILVVSFNYRLGIFGFFSTLNDDSPGNYGPKDQVLALKWVQANIEHFGGDKNQVTIFGQSAGAGATHHLMLSPLGKGLFQRAISESGTALCVFAKPLDVLQAVIYPAAGQLLGCDPSNTSAMMDCMRTLDVDVLMNVQDNFKYFNRDPLIIYTHVLEKRSERNPEPFLEREPVDIIQSGNFQKVPWIVGNVQNEGALKAAPNLMESKIRDDFLSRFDELGAKELVLEVSLAAEDIPDFWEEVKDFYLQGEPIDITKPETVQRYIDMIGERMFVYGSYQAALLHSMQGHPIWYYNFNYTGSRSFANSVFVKDAEDTADINFGVSHCDELLYILHSPDLFPDYEMTHDELQMSKVMIALWTNFAITGNPHKHWQPLPSVSGRPATNKDLHYLDIRGPEDLVLRNDYRRRNMQFWTDSKILENVPAIS